MTSVAGETKKSASTSGTSLSEKECASRRISRWTVRSSATKKSPANVHIGSETTSWVCGTWRSTAKIPRAQATTHALRAQMRAAARAVELRDLMLAPPREGPDRAAGFPAPATCEEG